MEIIRGSSPHCPPRHGRPAVAGDADDGGDRWAAARPDAAAGAAAGEEVEEGRRALGRRSRGAGFPREGRPHAVTPRGIYTDRSTSARRTTRTTSGRPRRGGAQVRQRCRDDVVATDHPRAKLGAALLAALLPPTGKRPAAAGAGERRAVRGADTTLFTVPAVTANWEAELNRESEVVLPGALVDPSVLGGLGGSSNPAAETHFQFERLGVFVVDKDSEAAAGGKLVFNRTVPLKQSKAKPKEASAEEEAKLRKRKEEQAKQMAAKAGKANLNPKEMFKVPGDTLEKYSAWDDLGIPTHFADKEPIPKNQIKKLKKDYEKQKKTFEKANKAP